MGKMAEWRDNVRAANWGRLFVMGHLNLDLSYQKELAAAMGMSLGGRTSQAEEAACAKALGPGPGNRKRTGRLSQQKVAGVVGDVSRGQSRRAVRTTAGVGIYSRELLGFKQGQGILFSQFIM